MIFEKSAVAVVSGGASGLGVATARKLTSMGACVAIFDLVEIQIALSEYE